jgi:hypothetical protein
MTVAARIPGSDEIIIITHAFMRLASFIRPTSRGGVVIYRHMRYLWLRKHTNKD